MTRIGRFLFTVGLAVTVLVTTFVIAYISTLLIAG